MSGSIPSASLFENARLNALVVVPNAVQGIFRRRRAAVAVATRANVDGHAVGLLEGMSRSYSGGPVWVRLAGDRALLLLDPADIERVLGGSPDPYAADPPAKRKGMVHFQPEAATISRGDDWRSRRRFIDAVLAPDSELGERIPTVCEEEAERLVSGPVAVAAGVAGWDDFHACVQRIARRLILGDGAGDDVALSELLERLMSEANSMPGQPADDLGELDTMIAVHLERAEPGSLAARFGTAPADERTAKAGQVPHWLFACGDTLAINAIRALAVLAADRELLDRSRADRAHLGAVLQETMRLWPTTTMLSRVTTTETELRGETLPAGTQVVIVNTYGHRDRERVDDPDLVVPGRWMTGDAESYAGFNHFSRGPQGCPGQSLSLAIGEALLGRLIAGLEPHLDSPSLDSEGPLPHMLDFFSIRVELVPA